MKKLLILAVLLSSSAFAYEVKDNPDRIPSVGLTYLGSFLKGDLTYESIAWSETPEYKQDTNAFLADLRLPVTSNLTVEVGGGFTKMKIDSIDGSLISLSPVTAIADRTSADLTGPTIKVGARYYFQ
jgi:hypothetical protein